jgi:hypothetical protein
MPVKELVIPTQIRLPHESGSGGSSRLSFDPSEILIFAQTKLEVERAYTYPFLVERKVLS